MMKHRVPHPLTTEQARHMCDAAFATYQERFTSHAPSLTWLDDQRATFSFLIESMKIHGTLVLAANALEIEAQVPWTLRLFSGLATRAIDAEVRRLLSAAQYDGARLATP